jgi:serine/threonine protein kinase
LITDDQFLGKYQLLERIGRGGMGEVYRARYLTGCDDEVAIKVMRADLTEDPTLSRRFFREARALTRLSHPYILPLIEYGNRDGKLYLVMPWIRDGTLSQLLRERGGLLPAEEAVPLFVQLCQAVQHAHECGIIHRDIKPQNVLVQHGQNVFLADFGIAIDSTQTYQTITREGVGSVEYMAPEQARGQATERSDLYSLGVVLYQMLTGAVPFTGEHPIQVLLKHALDPLPDPRQFQPALPLELVQILQTALAKDPGARFASARTLADAVEQSQSTASQPTEPVDLPAYLPAGRPFQSADDEVWSAWPEGWSSGSNQDVFMASTAGRQRLFTRHRTLAAGGITAAFLLLMSLAALGSHPGQNARPSQTDTQASHQPGTPTTAVPTPSPTPSPSRPPSAPPAAPPPPSAAPAHSQGAGNQGHKGGKGDNDGGKGGQGHGGKHGKGKGGKGKE